MRESKQASQLKQLNGRQANLKNTGFHNMYNQANDNSQRLKIVAGLMILLFIVYFLIGLIFVLVNVWSVETYITWAGIVGGLASVIGLLSFFQVQSNKLNLHELELTALQELIEKSRELDQLEQQRLTTLNDIDNLELQKQQMEVLIRKASLSLFLQEQLKLYTSKIQDEISQNSVLARNLAEVRDINTKLNVLEQEIENDENVILLQKIIKEAKRQEASNTVVIESPLFRLAFNISEIATQVASLAIRRF